MVQSDQKTCGKDGVHPQCAFVKLGGYAFFLYCQFRYLLFSFFLLDRFLPNFGKLLNLISYRSPGYFRSYQFKLDLGSSRLLFRYVYFFGRTTLLLLAKSQFKSLENHNLQIKSSKNLLMVLK